MSERLEDIREPKSLFDTETEDDEVDIQLEEIKDPKSLFDDIAEKGEGGMQTLGLNDIPYVKRRWDYWRRQFQKEPTNKQIKYDWTFGAFLPVLCIFFDPFVFRGFGGDQGMLSFVQPFVYVGSSLSIFLMIAWLLWREKLSALAAPLAGVFFVASAIAFVIGVVLLPFTIIGSFFLIGVLGLTPFFTSVVFLRNGVRALRAAAPHLPTITLVYAIVTAAIFSFVLPYTLNGNEVARNYLSISHENQTGNSKHW